jgi:hypothetical protein
MDTRINPPVSPTTTQWTTEPVLDRHAGQPVTDRVTGRCAQRQRDSRRNQRHPARLTRAGGRNTLSLFAGRRIA